MGMVSRPRWKISKGSRIDTNAQTLRILSAGRVFVALITLAMVGVLVRVIQLQTYPPEQIAKRLGSQYSNGKLQARRGNFLDRRSRVLATTRVARRLFVDPKLIKVPNTFSEQVAHRLGYDPAKIEQKLHKSVNHRYVVIDPRLSDDRVAKLLDFKLAGLASESFTVREYPHGVLAGQLIGFVGIDGYGLEGLERVFDAAVRGQTGRLRYLRDAFAHPLWVEHTGYRPPIDGQSVQLSLDVMIQSIAETHLRQACDKFQAGSGELIVMDPGTGEILAMANYPAFDPGQLTQSDPSQWRNRCVSDVYEPGSTFKPFIWAAAIEAGLVHCDQEIDCTESGVFRTLKGRRIHDAHPHGRITWDQVLIKSSNIGMATIGQQMTPQQMYSIVKAFGFGSVTRSGLPGEVAGIVRRPEKWNHYSLTSVPMGQEIAVTPLQLVTAFCGIVNGGVRVDPTILARSSIDAQSQSTLIYERVLAPDTAAATCRVLRRVVTEGTGRRANSKLYTLFGKTGTAQIADHVNGGYLEDQYDSSFMAAAPLKNPTVAVVCVIHRPLITLGHYGGTVAAPAVKQVIEQTLAYLGVPPQANPEVSAGQWASK